MSTPFFTVIVVCRNAGDKLHTTVESILSQTEDDYEILVKDAMSDDGSIEALPEDPRIRVIRARDKGIYDGMNAAVREARGEILYFLNCGDILHSNTVLQNVHSKITEHRKAIYYGDVIERTSGQHVMANPVMDHFAMFRYLPCHQACFYTKDTFDERAFDIQYKVRADYEHFLWSVIEGNTQAVYLDLIVADYEGGGFSETEKGRALSAAEHREITEQYFSASELFKFRAYLILTLQPLRAAIAQNKVTAGAYDAIKNTIYKMKR